MTGYCRVSQLRELLALCICVFHTLTCRQAKLENVQGRACICRYADVSNHYSLTIQDNNYMNMFSWMRPCKSPREELKLAGGCRLHMQIYRRDLSNHGIWYPQVVPTPTESEEWLNLILTLPLESWTHCKSIL